MLINVGRGDLLSERTVLHALDRGWLRHFVGDVFVPEPLQPDSALWRHSRVTVTPHAAALTTADDVAAAFAENLARYERGERLRHVFDFERSY